MNERIKLFAKLAEEYTYGDDGMTYDQTIQNETSYEEIFDQKFAELIVKEILNISDEVITIGDGPEWLICERLGINHDWRRQDNFWS